MFITYSLVWHSFYVDVFKGKNESVIFFMFIYLIVSL